MVYYVHGGDQVKIIKNSGSYKIAIPPALLKSLGWNEHDELKAIQVGKTVVLSLKETSK